MNETVVKALNAKRESKYIEFKEALDVSSQGEWCEIIKDVVAIANTGGGVILIGVDNQGDPTGFDVKPILEIDSADITNKIHKYTGVQFSEFEISEEEKHGCTIAALTIHGVSIPIVFTKPGTYDIGGGKQKSAFAAGTVYFRHGAKSEPGNTEDIRRVIERQLESVRKHWIRGVRKVVTAPQGSRIVVASGEVKESSSPEATPIRIVDDPKAPAYRKIDYDISHPYRLKDVVPKLNAKLKGKATVSPYDVLCLRRSYDLDGNSIYCHKPLFASMQYSDAFVDWVAEQFAKDSQLFEKARKKCFELRLVGKRKNKNSP
jgi:hypothetical protein